MPYFCSKDQGIAVHVGLAVTHATQTLTVHFLKVCIILIKKFWSNSSVIRWKGESQNAGNKKKAPQIFRKRNIFNALIRASACAYHRIRNVPYSEKLACFMFLLPAFWDSSLCLIIEEIFFRYYICYFFPAFPWCLKCFQYWQNKVLNCFLPVFLLPRTSTRDSYYSKTGIIYLVHMKNFPKN